MCTIKVLCMFPRINIFEVVEDVKLIQEFAASLQEIWRFLIVLCVFHNIWTCNQNLCGRNKLV